MITHDNVVLTVSGLRKEFPVRGRAGAQQVITAIDGIDFSVKYGETLALVGESGSGKSTVARCIVRLTEPTSGEVTIDGKTMRSDRRSLASAYKTVQMVFQDPNSSLNPRMTVRAILDEPLRLHSKLERSLRDEKILDLLESVELGEDYLHRRPWQLSGGQRQRIGIARALAVDPKIILLDEPTASLDALVQSRVLELLQKLQEQKGLAYLFISHDLSVVRKIADRVLVMYLGGIIEQGCTDEVFDRPMHPYTRALLSSAPIAEFGRVKSRLILGGDIPTPTNLPSGCRLAGRCPLAVDSCSESVPPLLPITPTHSAACPVVANARPPTAGNPKPGRTGVPSGIAES